MLKIVVEIHHLIYSQHHLMLHRQLVNLQSQSEPCRPDHERLPQICPQALKLAYFFNSY